MTKHSLLPFLWNLLSQFVPIHKVYFLSSWFLCHSCCDDLFWGLVILFLDVCSQRRGENIGNNIPLLYASLNIIESVAVSFSDSLLSVLSLCIFGAFWWEEKERVSRLSLTLVSCLSTLHAMSCLLWKSCLVKKPFLVPHLPLHFLVYVSSSHLSLVFLLWCQKRLRCHFLPKIFSLQKRRERSLLLISFLLLYSKTRRDVLTGETNIRRNVSWMSLHPWLHPQFLFLSPILCVMSCCPLVSSSFVHLFWKAFSAIKGNSEGDRQEKEGQIKRERELSPWSPLHTVCHCFLFVLHLNPLLFFSTFVLFSKICVNTYRFDSIPLTASISLEVNEDEREDFLESTFEGIGRKTSGRNGRRCRERREPRKILFSFIPTNVYSVPSSLSVSGVSWELLLFMLLLYSLCFCVFLLQVLFLIFFTDSLHL